MKKIDVVEILGVELDLFQKEDEFYFSAVDVADIIEYSKANVSKLVSQVDEDEKKQFCVHTKSTSTKARNQKQWFVTKDGLYELLFLSKKPKARDFKKQIKSILKNIENNGYYIATKKDEIWLGTRKKCKENRIKECEEICELVKYAESQGSKNANKYYIHYTKIANDKIGIKSNERDNITQDQLFTLIACEECIKRKIRQYIGEGLHYKDVYKKVKEFIQLI